MEGSKVDNRDETRIKQQGKHVNLYQRRGGGSCWVVEEGQAIKRQSEKEDKMTVMIRVVSETKG